MQDAGTCSGEPQQGIRGRATILKVNVDNDPDLARRFGVAAIPTLVLFQDGAEVKTVMGYQAAPTLRQLLDSVL